MGSCVDDSGLATRRWLALVCNWRYSLALRRPRSIRRRGRGDDLRDDFAHGLPAAEKNDRPHTALRDRAELLGNAPAARSVLVPVRSFHDGLFGRRAFEPVLSLTRDRIAVL